MDTRLFGYTCPDSPEQLKAALDMAAQRHLDGTAPAPRPEFIAFQRYLQVMAPIGVVFPYVRELNDLLRRRQKVLDPRLNRDSARLRALICALALLRQHRRDPEPDGQKRIVATLDDYETVRTLITEMYRTTTSGISPRLREIVTYVDTQVGGASVMQIANHFKIGRQSVWEHVRKAISDGWLQNTETRPKHQAHLKVPTGVTLPPIDLGLPTKEEILAWRPERTPVARTPPENGLTP